MATSNSKKKQPAKTRTNATSSKSSSAKQSVLSKDAEGEQTHSSFLNTDETMTSLSSDIIGLSISDNDVVKAMVIGDLHIRRNEIDATNIMCEDILNICKSNKVDFIVCLGDTLHEHDIVRLDPLRRATTFLKKLGDIAPLFVLIGNHDIENNQVNLQKIEKKLRKHSFIDLLSSYNGNPITVVDEIVKWTIKGQEFCFTPFFPAGQYSSTLGLCDIDVTSYTSFFSHQDWIGSKYTLDSEPSNFGDKWPNDASFNISGHIHEEQKIQNNLHIVGTPAPTRFGESNNKGIFLYSFFGPNDRSYQKISLPNAILRISKEFKVTEQLEMSSFYEEESEKQNNHNLYRTVICGGDAEVKNFMKTELCKNLKKLGKVIPKYLDDDNEEFQIKTIGEDWIKQRNKKFSDLFFNYLTENEVKEFEEINETLVRIFNK